MTVQTPIATRASLKAAGRTELVRLVLAFSEKIDDLSFAIAQMTEPPKSADSPPEAFCPDLDDVHLTRIERRFLGMLCRRAGHTLSKENLIAAMNWDRPVDDWPLDKIVDVVACKLRRKLGDRIDIQTIWGVGYRVPAPSKALPAPAEDALA